MKIAYIVRHYNKNGGIERHIVELSTRLSIHHEVHVFCASHDDSISSGRIKFHKVSIISFEILKKLKKYAWNNIFEILSFKINARRMIQEEEYDIVHSQGGFTGKLIFFTAHSCHKAWLKLARRHSSRFVDTLMKSNYNPLHVIMLSNEKYEVMNSDQIIAVSSGVKKEIEEYYKVHGEKIAVITNGVDLNRFTPGNRFKFRSMIRTKYSLPEDAFVMIFPAHEFRRKGLLQILDAMRILRNKDIYLLVVGKDDPENYQRVVAEYDIQENVIFVGKVRSMEEYYAAADIMIFPTLYEAFAMVTLEAIASGLPLLCTRVNGTDEILQNEVNGLVIERDAKDVARKINKVYSDRNVLEAYGAASRKIAENFSWDNIAQQTLALYNDFINRKKPNENRDEI